MIERFAGEYRFLSNFWLCPVEVDGITYTNAEAAYQAQKSNNPTIKKSFARLLPGIAKTAGKHITMRPDFEGEKIEVMKTVVSLKFLQNPDLAKKLIDTYPQELQEGNDWGDMFWGVCMGQGQNYLGKVLMQVREQLMLKNRS